MPRQRPVVDDILLPAAPNETCGWGRLRRILRDFPCEPLEVISALGVGVTGLWFIYPGHPFPTYGVLFAAYGNGRQLWGVVAFLLSCFQWWVVLWCGERAGYRLIAACVVGLFLSALFNAYLYHAPSHLMVPVMAVWVVMQGWVAYRSQKVCWRPKG